MNSYYNTVEDVRMRCPVLADALVHNGYRSINQMCKAEHLHSTIVGELVNGKRSIYLPSGGYIDAAKKIAEICGETPEIVFNVDDKLLDIDSVQKRPRIVDIPWSIDRKQTWKTIKGVITEIEFFIMYRMFHDGCSVRTVCHEIAAMLNDGKLDELVEKDMARDIWDDYRKVDFMHRHRLHPRYYVNKWIRSATRKLRSNERFIQYRR